MRILITGVAGFVGSHLAEALVDRGNEVVGVDAFIDYYPRRIKEANLAGLIERPGFEFHELDLRTAPIRPLLDSRTSVVHLAAMPGLARSWTDVELYTTCNLLATQRLVEAALDAAVPKLVHASTSSVYGSDAVGDETTPTQPISPYGVTKLAAEHLILAHVRTGGLPATILRYFSMFGPRQRPDMAYHIFIEALIDGRPITVFGDGEQSRSNTFIADCVRGTIAAIEDAEVGEIYNIAGGEEITLNEAIATIARVLRVEPVIDHEPARPGDQRRTFADTAKARAAFGFEPVVGATEGLEAQVAWQVARRAGSTLG
jgi:nucleoside-diphosphate-sugar epimerase